MRKSLHILLFLVGFVASCAPRVAIPFAKNSAEAERAYGAGRYEEAARHWAEAGAVADNRYDREEASYREAQCFLKLGDLNRARPLLLALERSSGDRAARAAYDLVVAEIERGDADAPPKLLQVAERFAESGSGRVAFRRYLSWFTETHDQALTLRELERLLPSLHKGELNQEAQYALAKALEENQQPEAALNHYLTLATSYPYPIGGYWDDALWHAALLEEKLGHPDRAVGHLRHMLRARESSSFVGSYERPRYDEAQLKIAALERDALHDSASAEKDLEKLWSSFPTSRLRDDALWQLAQLKLSRNNRNGACADVSTLSKQMPESRFAPCAYLVCPTVAKLPRPCGDYLIRQVSVQPGAEH